MAVDGYVINRLVASDGLGVDVADIDDVAVGLYEVDVGIAIDGYQPLGLLTPAYQGDVGVAESVDFLLSDNGLVVLVILIEVVGGHHKEIVAGILYLLDIVIGQIIAPRADLSK